MSVFFWFRSRDTNKKVAWLLAENESSNGIAYINLSRIPARSGRAKRLAQVELGGKNSAAVHGNTLAARRWCERWLLRRRAFAECLMGIAAEPVILE